MYLVHYYRREDRKKPTIRKVTHHNRQGYPDKEFRLMLIAEYNRTKKRVLKIEKVEDEVSGLYQD